MSSQKEFRSTSTSNPMNYDLKSPGNNHQSTAAPDEPAFSHERTPMKETTNARVFYSSIYHVLFKLQYYVTLNVPRNTIRNLIWGSARRDPNERFLFLFYDETAFYTAVLTLLVLFAHAMFLVEVIQEVLEECLSISDQTDPFPPLAVGVWLCSLYAANTATQELVENIPLEVFGLTEEELIEFWRLRISSTLKANAGAVDVSRDNSEELNFKKAMEASLHHHQLTSAVRSVESRPVEVDRTGVFTAGEGTNIELTPSNRTAEGSEADGYSEDIRRSNGIDQNMSSTLQRATSKQTAATSLNDLKTVVSKKLGSPEEMRAFWIERCYLYFSTLIIFAMNLMLLVTVGLIMITSDDFLDLAQNFISLEIVIQVHKVVPIGLAIPDIAPDYRSKMWLETVCELEDEGKVPTGVLVRMNNSNGKCGKKNIILERKSVRDWYQRIFFFFLLFVWAIAYLGILHCGYLKGT